MSSRLLNTAKAIICKQHLKSIDQERGTESLHTMEPCKGHQQTEKMGLHSDITKYKRKTSQGDCQETYDNIQ